MNIGKGLLRVYIILWIFLVAFLAADQYKQLATYIGVERWSEEGRRKEADELCKEQKRDTLERQAKGEKITEEKIFWKEIICRSIKTPISWQEAKNSAESFLYIALVLPLLFLVLGICIFAALKWIIAGFKK